MQIKPTLNDRFENHPHDSKHMQNTGYFGNIWWREHVFVNAGDFHQGHRHKFDHITLIVRGKVKCYVEDETGTMNEKVFIAPSVCIIKKEHWHRFEALTDYAVYYCLHAMRDEQGEITETYSNDVSPYGWAVDEPGEAERKLEKFIEFSDKMCDGDCQCK
jgi:tellurite resistance-related uncharacterized protein